MKSPLEVFSTKWLFPDPENADPDGLLAVGADLSPGTLLAAYSRGIFPWTSDPITWWSPDPRTILEIENFYVPRRLQRILRKGDFQVSIDRAFQKVMEECAKPWPGREKTWISDSFIEAYTRLHSLGFAHSAECWKGKNLVGGVYGVCIGGFFAGESMFSRESNASRIALTHLMKILLENGFILFDAQVPNPHLKILGAIEIPRSEYLRRLRRAISLPIKISN